MPRHRFQPPVGTDDRAATQQPSTLARHDEDFTHALANNHVADLQNLIYARFALPDDQIGLSPEEQPSRLEAVVSTLSRFGGVAVLIAALAALAVAVL
ncbi:hypothetical protein [Sphingomonas sp.]|uniref:hypothetical protein n=1 Tax=Sphingomonas sp. TaxID=28214 RepID=UPI0025E75C64|nr:hypothetical protein [Sphingomonas sp.]